MKYLIKSPPVIFAINSMPHIALVLKTKPFFTKASYLFLILSHGTVGCQPCHDIVFVKPLCHGSFFVEVGEIIDDAGVQTLLGKGRDSQCAKENSQYFSHMSMFTGRIC